MQRRRSPSASTASSIAMMCCAFSSSAATRSCRPRTDRTGLAHRLRSERRPDRARLPGQRERHGAADHPGQGADRQADIPSEPPGAAQRAERLSAVAAMIYLTFNEGYSATGEAVTPRRPLCDEAARLARLLLKLYPAEPEVMGLAALMLPRARARIAEDGRSSFSKTRIDACGIAP